MRLLAIDPGSTQSAYVVVDLDTYRPVEFAKVDNEELLMQITNCRLHYDRAVIEMVASYGMPVGAEVFDTVVWIGRYLQAILDTDAEARLGYRRDVKVHLCNSVKASDANISQALVDRFAYGISNHGKGTKKDPGFFYGFRADVWAAYALAVYHADTQLFQLAR